MKSKILSRGPQIDTEKCVRNVGMGRFDLVLVAAQRAREIRRHNKESDKYEHTHSIVTALLEIQEGSIIDPIEYLRKVK